MIKLFTIGFTGKSAETFFNLLRNNNVRKIVDVRINNISQLAGFTKGRDLNFFAREICNIGYEHKIDFAPIKELLSRYRDKEITLQEYKTEYLTLLEMRNITQKTDIEKLHENCLLCSERIPEECHRKLLAEYFKQVNNEIEIIHLI